MHIIYEIIHTFLIFGMVLCPNIIVWDVLFFISLKDIIIQGLHYAGIKLFFFKYCKRQQFKYEQRENKPYHNTMSTKQVSR